MGHRPERGAEMGQYADCQNPRPGLANRTAGGESTISVPRFNNKAPPAPLFPSPRRAEGGKPLPPSSGGSTIRPLSLDRSQESVLFGQTVQRQSRCGGLPPDGPRPDDTTPSPLPEVETG